MLDTKTYHQSEVKRNTGVSLDASWFDQHQVNTSAAERRAASLSARRSVKKEYQAAFLVKALQCMDLTTLAGDDTQGRVQRLCAKARQPPVSYTHLRAHET